MANRVILYDQTYDSETKKENRTQFNPVTDIESVFHSAKQVSNGSEPVGNNIFTANQESLLTVLSRINTWLYKLKALNNYEVALDKNARDNDLALQKTVNTQISQINEEISVDKTSIDLLQQKVQYLDDIIIDMAYNMDCIKYSNVNISSTSTSFYTWYKHESSLADSGSNYYAHDDKLLLLGIKVSVYDYKYYLFKIGIMNATLENLGPVPELLTTKNSSDITIHSKDSVDYAALPSDAYANVIDFNDEDLIIYFVPSINGDTLVNIDFRVATLSDSIGGVYARIIQGIPKQSSPKK